MPSLSIVIPAYNEELRLPESMEAVLRYLDASSWASPEVIVVDDGSRDGTAAYVERVAARDGRVRLLKNPGNRGKGYAVRHGMLAAVRDWVLCTDADLSSPIEQVDVLARKALEANASVAIGSRALDRSLIEVHQSPLRENAGRVFNFLMRVITGLPFQDTQCGFKLYKREVVGDIFSRQQLDGFGFDVENLYVARVRGFKTIEVPVRWKNAEGTKVSMLLGLNSFLDPLRVRWFDLQGRYR